MNGIKIENVSKVFKLRHNCDKSLKSFAVGLLHRKYRQNIERFTALKNINIEVPQSKILGIVGHNGSGKSTLLQVVAGILSPTTGKVTLPENAKVGTMIQLGVGFSPELTGSENIFLNASLYGFPRDKINQEYNRIVEFSELEHFIDTPIKNYSSGMLAKLGFSIISHLPMEIVLIDEVLAVGDEAFRTKCLTKMHEFKEEKRTILFVSHSPQMVSEFCDQVCLLYQGEQLGLGAPNDILDIHRQLMLKQIGPQEAREHISLN